MTRITALIAIAGLVLAMAGIAAAHGGIYNGAGGVATGNNNGPQGTGTTTPTPGPGNGGQGTTTPGQNGGNSTGPVGPGNGRGPARPGGRGGAGHRVGGAQGGSTKKPDSSGSGVSWDAWWFHNHEAMLQLKAKVRAERTSTVQGDLFLGHPAAGPDTTGVTLRRIRNKVLPALGLATRDPFYDARAAAVIALGKCDTDSAAVIRRGLTDPDARVRESACLGLGLTGDRDAIPDLVDIMNDTRRGRALMGRDAELRVRTRAFAAVALGMIGSSRDVSDSGAVSALLRLVDTRHAAQDLQVAPIVALGLMRDARAVPPLSAFLTDPERDVVARSFAATSLGKIGDRAALDALVAALRDKHNAVVQSAVIALGALATEDDAAIYAAVKKIAGTRADRASRNFALVTMGRMGGPRARNDLVAVMKGAANAHDRTFAAMGLGVWGFHGEDTEEAAVGAMILARFKSTRSPVERGAYAIALGLLGHEPAGDTLLDALREGGQASYRAHLCTALGLLRHEPAVADVREVVGERGDVSLRQAAAIALGLLGDKDAVAVLEKEIADSANSQAVLGAATRGLGFIGDVSAVGTLTDMVVRRDAHKDNSRAFAAVALGLLGDRNDVSPMSRIRADNNFLVSTNAIAELLTLL